MGGGGFQLTPMFFLNCNSVELEASLAPAGAEVGAVAKADQKSRMKY